MRRAVVYGSGGAGKSTFASELARQRQIAHIEIDLLAFDSNGIHVPQELLRERFEGAIAADGWVVEGMHRDQLYRALDAADIFVWLDYSKAVVVRRLGARLFRQLVLRRERHGRKTSARSALDRELPFMRKTLRNHGRRRVHGEALAVKATSLGVRVQRVSSPSGASRLLRSLEGGRSGG